MNLQWILEAFYYYLPAYIANATPVVLNGGGPIDFGIKWIDDRPLFGSHKTIIGTASGIIAGTFIGGIQQRLLNGLLLAIGAIGGDMATSFLKRRLDLEPGTSFPVADQLGFILIAALLGYLIPPKVDVWQTVIVIVATLPIHYLVNIIAYLLKMKEHPW